MFITKQLRRNAAALTLTTLLAGGLASCTKDLDREPFYDLNVESVYGDPSKHIQVLSKLYAGFNLSGDPGQPDVFAGQGKDEGETSYLRAYWYLQELVTDEAVVAWNSVPLQELNRTSWSSSNDLMNNSYARIFYEVTICNDFIRETSDDKLADRNITGMEADRARTFRAEVRFLRALAYYHALDLYGNVPFVTEADAPSKNLPKQISRAELFQYVESELKTIESQLLPARQAPYGRADQGAAWALLAKLYLNARVYTGTERATDCLTYCNKLLAPAAGYELAPEYRFLFLADNNKTAAREIIFPITSDGRVSQTYGGTTYLVHAAIGGRMLSGGFGVNSGWAGNRTRKNLPQLFPTPASGFDTRAMFFTAGQKLEIDNLTEFTDGYGVTKWRNKTSTGENGSDLTFVDTDFPLLRLGDVYLMYAEAVLRGGQGGTRELALTYVNRLRDRAFGNVSGGTDGHITAAQLTTDFLLDERGRELYWEATRRTDLVRFGKFTSASYVWPWKGGTKPGQGVAPHLDLYPLPAADLVANPTLKQNPGY